MYSSGRTASRASCFSHLQVPALLIFIRAKRQPGRHHRRVSFVSQGFSGGHGRPPANQSVQLRWHLSPQTENPRVDGSIPSLATTSNFMISLGFRASCAPQIFDQGRTDAVAGSSASCGMIVT